MCSEQDGKCVASKDADCRNAAICVKLGRCVAKDGMCVLAEGKTARANM
jgi:hypothetical protein